jgi:hypothetical protein
MILGLTLSAFTFLHVVISIVAIFAGLLAVLGLIVNRSFPIINAIFLVLTVLTSVTGFLFPFKGLTPGIVVGILSMIVLALAIVARYIGHLSGGWRGAYVVSAVIALYFNMFVFIVQSFEKVPSLKVLAPTQSEPPFKIAQGLTLLLFLVLGFLSFRRFHPED